MKLHVESITVRIKQKEIIRNISLKTKPKQFVGIIGANGSGKSTLLKTIYKSIAPTEGAIWLNELNVVTAHERLVSQNMSVVGQFNDVSFDLNVYQMVLLGRTPHKKLLESDTTEDHEIVEAALEKTNLQTYRKRSWQSLSGGEKQRVILARAIAQKPKYMVLDEPTNHLDIRYQLEILETVNKLNISVFAALHDLELTAKYCDYIYALKDGEVIAQGETMEVLTEEMIEKIFSVKCKTYVNPITNKLGFSYYL